MAFPDDLLAPGEEVAHRFRPHVAIVFAGIAWAVLATAFLNAVARNPDDNIVVGVGIILAFFYLNVVRLVWQWIFTYYAVTRYRVIWRAGLIWRNTREIPLSKIDHLDVREGLLGRIFRYGDVVLRSSGINGQVVWRAVPRVKTVRKWLTQLRQEDQERRTNT